jgi:uncharacterized protein YbaR (Trm112 family)
LTTSSGLGPKWTAVPNSAEMAAGHFSQEDNLDTRLLEILACPICKGTLKFQRDAQVLVCRMDRLAYPIRDDVPVMLEEEARQLSADDPLLDR